MPRCLPTLAIGLAALLVTPAVAEFDLQATVQAAAAGSTVRVPAGR